MIIYRNPAEQWFWEGGWVNVVVATIIVMAAYWLWWTVVEWRDRRQRKRKWDAMNEAQRASWRHFNRRNNFDAERWEK